MCVCTLTHDLVPHNTQVVLLIITFPTLRLLWSRNATATAESFAALKKHQPEPDEVIAASITTETTDILEKADDGFAPGPKVWCLARGKRLIIVFCLLVLYTVEPSINE